MERALSARTEGARVGFFERNRQALLEKGYNPDRLPPGQYFTERYPILHVGDVPEIAPAQWNLRVFGLVENERTFVLISYVLHLLGSVAGLTSIVGLVLNYLKRRGNDDSFDSHHAWMIRSFWWAVLWGVMKHLRAKLSPLAPMPRLGRLMSQMN